MMIMTNITTGTTSATLGKHSVLGMQVAGVQISMLVTIIWNVKEVSSNTGDETSRV